MDEHALADSLDRFLDRLVSGKESGGEVDPELASTARRYHALGQSPAPSGARDCVQRRILSSTEDVSRGSEDRNGHVYDGDVAHPAAGLDDRLDAPLTTPASANRRRANLMPVASTPPTLGASRNGRAPTHLLEPIAPQISRPTRPATVLTQPRALTRVAAAIMLIAVMAGAVVALLYPLRLWEGARIALVAGSETPAAEAVAGETTLFELTLADIPTYRAQLGIETSTIQPGSTLEERSGAGPQLFYVAAGPVTVRARTAPEPLWVIPAGSAGAEPSQVLVAQGQQATLATGFALLAPEGAVVDLFTTESMPAQVMGLLSATNSQEHHDGGVTWEWASNGGSIQILTSPVSIVLRQATLEPDATLPAPASGDTHQVAGLLDPARLGDLRTGTGGAVRNAGDQPFDLYVLTVAYSAAAAMPATPETSA